MVRRPTTAELETIATAITQQQLTLHKKLAVVQRQLQHALIEIGAAKAELQEAHERLDEIEVCLEDVEDEVDALRTLHGEDSELFEQKQDEFDELLEEREDELGLLEQLERVHALRASVAAHLRRMQMHFTDALARSKHRQRLLAMIALRSGAVRLTPRKLQ